jgi:hypothetical protein
MQNETFSGFLCLIRVVAKSGGMFSPQILNRALALLQGNRRRVGRSERMAIGATYLEMFTTRYLGIAGMICYTACSAHGPTIVAGSITK